METTFINNPRYYKITSFLCSFMEDVMATDGVEGKSDREVVEAHVQRCPESSKEALEQSKDVLREDPFPWEEIRDITNRYFRNEKEARDWFITVTKMLEESLCS